VGRYELSKLTLVPLVIEPKSPSKTSTPKTAMHLMHRDLTHPRAKSIMISETLEVAERLIEGVLRHVLCVRRATEKASRPAKHGRRVTNDKGFRRPAIPRESPLDEFPIADGVLIAPSGNEAQLGYRRA
jgi:hypothetical protein